MAHVLSRSSLTLACAHKCSQQCRKGRGAAALAQGGFYGEVLIHGAPMHLRVGTGTGGGGGGSRIVTYLLNTEEQAWK